jgi:hypothetical protein
LSDGKREIDVRVSSLGAPRDVYRLLIDGPSWPAWSDFERVEIERHGEAGPLGEIRINITRITRVREQCVEAIPDRRYSYMALSGMPMREYRADVDLEPTSSGCTIHWRASYLYDGWPGTGWLFHRVLGGFIARTARQLARAAAIDTRSRE